MNKKMIVLVSFVLVALFITPVFAKTKTEIKALQLGSTDPSSVDKVVETPNTLRLWGVDGTGTVTLSYTNDVEIDTFDTSSVTDVKITDEATMYKSVMLWESNTFDDSGFEGIIQWRSSELEGVDVEMHCTYQGYGEYAGQTLKMEGTAVPGIQTYTGILIA